MQKAAPLREALQQLVTAIPQLLNSVDVAIYKCAKRVRLLLVIPPPPPAHSPSHHLEYSVV